MLYFDTSFLAPLILEEATSTAVEEFMAGLRPGALAVSHWTRVEFSSLLAREVRMGGLDPWAAKAADAQFETMIHESFAVFTPNAEDFNAARRFIGNYDTGLRAGDALHLAIARSNQAEMIYSLDKTLLKAGRALALPVSTGIAVSNEP